MSVVLRILAWLIAVALVALPVVAVLNGWVGAERWPLSRLRVTGEFERVDPEQVRAAVLPHAVRGFFAAPLPQAQDAVERLPWVERAHVRKQWPDVLEIHIVEHKPFARWGEDRLLSTHGRLFPMPADLADEDFPRLDGPDARSGEVVELYNEARALFAPLGLEVVALRMDARGSWSLSLGNGIEVVIGRDDAGARLARFARVLPQLLAQGGQAIERADLRYTNGFALVRAKPGVGSLEPGMERTPSVATRSAVPALHTPFPVSGSTT